MLRNLVLFFVCFLIGLLGALGIAAAVHGFGGGWFVTLAAYLLAFYVWDHSHALFGWIKRGRFDTVTPRREDTRRRAIKLLSVR